MADLAITAADVHINGATASVNRVQFGEAVAAGETVYLRSSDSKYWRADADAGSEEATTAGIVVNGNAADGYGLICTSGPIDVGATLTKGTAYAQSDTPGGIMPVADFDAGDYMTLLGIATATDTLDLHIRVTGATF